ncbi:MAG: aminopeptidase, partial [Crocinitomicaceae bacterium]|nr:aminopeptidase [Crocinitomicaceae bacterium]
GQDTIKNSEKSNYRFEKIVHLDATPVQSQGFAGTCWSFSGLSFFESELIRMGNKKAPILSEMFVVRKAYEEKADKYIRMDGKSNFGQGGGFVDIPYVINKYGIVPEEAYLGLNYGKNNHDHNELFSVLDGAVQGMLKHSKDEMDKQHSNGITKTWKLAVSGILDAYLGKEPQTFKYEGKEYTPKSYAQSLKLDMSNYVSITSYMNEPLYQPTQLAIPDNWLWESSYNVKLDELFTIVEHALKNGYTIAWGADVSEKGFSFRDGLAIVPEDDATIEVNGRDNKNFSDAGAKKISNAFLTPVKEKVITPEMRQEGYDTKLTTDDHGMHIVGMYKDQAGTKYFLVKNSWGSDRNYPKGYFYASEAYFKLKTMNYFLHKDALPKEIRSNLKIN